MEKINIAIDGPSAAGKSTIANTLAAKLHYVHLDTGAMYRCTACKALQQHLDLDDENQIADMLAHTEIVLTPEGKVFLDGKDVSEEIRHEDISLAASRVSKLKRVRQDLVKRQQVMAAAKGFIMDGRDIGTVVLPDAEVKVFLTASPMARARRRYLQDKEKGLQVESVEQIAAEIAERDKQDTSRKESPLVKAADAVEIDTSDLSFDESADAVYRLVEAYFAKEKQA